MAGGTPLRTIGSVTATAIFNSRVLVIGSTTFGEDEHPPELKFGLEQKKAVHDLIGGTRYVQPLGAFGREITWRGNLYGDNIKQRVNALYLQAQTGAEQRLKWLLERYDVSVDNFDWEYDSPVYARYEITVTVIRDASGRTAASTAGSTSTQAATSAATAAAIAKSMSTYYANNPAGAAFAAAKAAGVDPNALQAAVNATTGNLPSSLSGSAAFFAQVNQTIAMVQKYLSIVGQVVPNSQIFQANQLLQQLQIMSANVSQGQTPRTIIAFGGSLATIAARELGDPSLGAAIGQANGITGTRLPTGVITNLIIPQLTGSKLG